MTTEQRSRARRTQRISGPAELVQAIPYLLGFHPQHSIVLVGLHEGQLVVTARVDIPDAVAADALPQTLAAMAAGGSTSVIAVIYDKECHPDEAFPWWQVIDMLDHEAKLSGCVVADTLLVNGKRWWSVRCDVPECCPPGGRELPDAPSPFTAAATFDGVVALPDRAALAAQLDPLPPADADALDAALARAEHAAVQATLEAHARRWERSVKRAIFAAARDCAELGWKRCHDADVARYGVALGVGVIRDAVWIAVDDGRLDGRELWRDLARRLPSPYDVAPLFLFGWASWRAGNGTMAGIAAERALASDPEYAHADLLLAAVAHGLDPRQVPRLRLPRSA